MKAYVFIETGEVKIPVKGEYVREDNCIYLTNRDHCHGALPILTRHEIRIQEKTTALNITPMIEATMMHMQEQYVPIPQPKKKVKKWRWVVKACKSEGDDGLFITEAYFTVAQANNYVYQINADWCRRIDETEIEVEE